MVFSFFYSLLFIPGERYTIPLKLIRDNDLVINRIPLDLHFVNEAFKPPLNLLPALHLKKEIAD
jgi:hypothetical protein